MRRRRPDGRILPRRKIDPVVNQDDDTARLETFSDGVMAIAITLLALEIEIDRAADESLAQAILGAWPLLLAYTISFLQIGIIWANHHNRFRYIGRSNHALLVLNTVFLMGVAFIPVPTKVLGEHLTGTGDELRSAAAFYVGTLAFTSVCFTSLWLYSSRHLLREGIDASVGRAMDRRYVAGLVMYLAAFGLAFVVPVASLTFVALLALRFLLPEPAERSR
jgi:uncharacterized membrane protein